MPQIAERLKSWLAINASHLVDELNEGANEQEIEMLEQNLSVVLPESFKSFYKTFNGQSRDGEGLVDSEELLSTERIHEEWNVWKRLLDEGDFNDIKSTPAQGIKNDWWNAKWIPITYDGGGNHYCIDLDPGPGGQKGQIIRMWHDAEERELIANSFEEWMSEYVEALEKGDYIYSEDWGGIINKEEL